MESESPARWVNAAQLHEEAPLPSGLQPALVFNLNLKGEPFHKLKAKDSVGQPDA
jgi:hypothetical protein